MNNQRMRTFALPPQIGCTDSRPFAQEQVPPESQEREHTLKDMRCECCGYMTYHREHMGCIRAARQGGAR